MPDVIINGPEGRLEGRYHHSRVPNAPVALVLHPHPLQGGTMHNRVVYNLHQVYARHGFSVLRFNFRGVGRSQGAFDRGEGELSDAASALDWLQTYNQNARACWIAGFSFGALIGMQLLMRRPELTRFVSIAPPANQHDFSFLAPCPASGMIIQGDRDEQVPESQVAKLVDKLSRERNIVVDYHIIPGANHYYNEHLEPLIRLMDAYIKKVDNEVAEAVTAR